MDRTRLILNSLLFFFFGAIAQGALGQAAAEAGLVHGLSSVSNASAASRLSTATSRALQGHKTAGGTVSRPATSKAVSRTRPAGSKVSTGSTTRGHSGVATATAHGTKLPNGIAHVWPEGALTQGAPQ
jgi:hypothetical protein